MDTPSDDYRTPVPAGNTRTQSDDAVRGELVDDIRVFGGNTPFGTSGVIASGTEMNALAALALAVSSFLILPVIGAIAALVLAPSAKRRIDESNGRLTGRGMAVAAQIIAVLNLVVCAVVAYAVVAFFRWIF